MSDVNGKFVISLDFELMWGVCDKRSIEDYGKNILAVHEVIPDLINLFDAYNVKATFATVGLLFCKDIDEAEKYTPEVLPTYNKQKLNPYTNHWSKIKKRKDTDKYHFAPELIGALLKNGNHEIGTHTFSHYYTLELGQNIDQFESDIKSAISVAKSCDVTLTSIVFPRNQYSDAYIDVCSRNGLICYRGTEQSEMYKSRNSETPSQFRRLKRLVDTYINISGHNCYSDEEMKSKFPVNIPSSRLLRPYNRKLSLLNALKLRRIKRSMTYAARKGKTYHLWWHPHNFGNHKSRNFEFLEAILQHYKKLHLQFGFESCTMTNLAKALGKNAA